MLSLKDIKKQYPPRLQAHSRSILREYLQYLILRVIFSQKYSHKLVFIGGTALRIVYNNNRFSEDLDFDNFGLTEAEFGNLAQAVETVLNREGYSVNVRVVKGKSFHCYVKIPQLLFKEGLSPLADEKLLIQIDTVSQNYRYRPRKAILNKFDIFARVSVASPDLLLSQKIYAIFKRPRLKGRDFYDVTFLWGNTAPDYRYLREKLGIANKKELLRKLREKLKNADFERLASDVENFLFVFEDRARVAQFSEFLASLQEPI